uniref:Uncharacterized protein n=1 Tax=Plectus sambesii TaxID=2011161 RepID=A0A914XSZ4_9BILA
MAPSPLIVDGNFPQCFLRNLREYRDLHFLCDCILRIETPQSVLNVDSDNHTDEIYAHRLVLAATSNFFKEIFLLKKDQKDSMTTVTLKLHSPDAVNCFKVILGFLYSGELHLKDCDPNHVFQVAKVCQITALEEQLRPPSPPKIPKQQPQQISSPTKSESNGRLNDNSPTPPARLNIFCADHKQMCCPCRNTSDGSLSSPYEARSMASFSPTSNAMAYVPVQSSMVSMVSTPSAVTLPTITAAEIRSNMIHHGYYGPLLPTTSNFLPTTPQSAPAFPSPGHQGFHPMMRFPLNGPQSMLSPSTPNSPLNGHPPRPLEGLMDQQQPSPRKVTAKRGTNAKLTQRPSPPDAPFDNLGDVIIPSSEKEGWCRNKKYIERVPSGFMCTVCRKVYGRYNSVSYHVTIYHRNPPIKCDEPGCQFTTREARYIHFHKYYRHHIALPESIDLGSRKCPFCRHVSKSPAMLEKHINRHMPECNRVGRMYQCQQCPKQLSSQRAMYDHMLTHNEDKNYPCDQCNYKGRTESN